MPSTHVGPVVIALMVLLVAGCTPSTAPGPATTAAQSHEAPAAALGPAAPAGPSGVTLHVLVLADGTPWSRALQDQLETEGIPFTVVDLQAAGRAPLTASFLGEADTDRARGHFSALIAPYAGSSLLGEAEQHLIQDYQTSFGVRLVETAPAADLNPVAADPYRGSIGGAEATVTDSGKAGAFSYLRGAVPITPGPEVTDAVLAPTAVGVPGEEVTPLVTVPIPGSDSSSPLIHSEVRAGRERLVFSFAGDTEHPEVRLLSHGVLRWVTRDISVSHYRSWFSVHADDILLPNSQWNIQFQCEIGRNCPPQVPTTGPEATVRMVPEDVDALVEWQRAHGGIVVDMVANGAGAGQYARAHGGTDPLADKLVAEQAELRWISHTFSHAFLGCQQILEPEDWRCVTQDGATRWVSPETLSREIVANQRFLAQLGVTHYSPAELVTGEHSGLRKPPQQPEDNPALAEVLARAGVTWIASDASEELWSRPVGAAMTVPRHPIVLDYFTPTARQAVAHFNWLNTTSAEGGSGVCAATADCVAPLDLDRGFTETIVPTEARKIADHMINDDPRPHYVHQGNLTADRLLYPVLNQALERRAAVYADSVPLLNPTLAEAGQAILDRQRWRESGQEQIEAIVSDRRVRITNQGPASVRVPVTLPAGARIVVAESVTGSFGEAYADQRSAWIELAPGASAEFETAAESGFHGAATWTRDR